MSAENRYADAPEMRSARAILFGCFFFSGVTGLVYEIIWVRLFSFVFGNTVYSTAAVLGAFMGGLGAGGWWAGRFIEKRKDSILYYAGAEVLIGLYAFVPGLFIALLESAYPSIYNMSGGSTSFLVIVKFVAALVVLALPTFCMGATLPLMSRFFINSTTRFGSGLSLLYGLNTFGAVCGTFLAGFLMLRFLGIHDSLVMAMIVNIGIGMLAWVQHKKLSEVPEDNEEETVQGEAADDTVTPDEVETVPGTLPPLFAKLMISGTFMAGFVSLLLEVAWVRALALIIGSTVYSFTLMLITFLLGISLGSLAIGRFLRNRPGYVQKAGPASLGIVFLGIAAAATASLFFMKISINVFALMMNLSSENYSVVLVFQFLICAVILLAPALLFGAAFPLAAALYSACSSTISSGLGRMYFWNTFGAIAGSVLTGFVLIPIVGVHKTLILGSLLMLVSGFVLVVPGSGISLTRRIGATVVALLIVVAFLTTQKWDRLLMTSGPFIYYEKSYAGITQRPILAREETGHLLYYGDGMTCTVSVRKYANGATALQVNGKTDASTKGDTLMQASLAVVPGLLHHNPEEIAVIGFGSGMTVGAALQFPEVKKMDVVEIEPRVLEAGRFFEHVNFKALDDERTKYYIEDGRNFFLTHRDRYDVIISEPSNHWIAGIANLYTLDFLKMASERLKPGGIYVQWIQSYNLAPFSLRMFLKTYHSVFPHVNVFLVRGEMLLIGSFEPLDLDAGRVAARFDQVDIDGKINSVLGTKYSRDSIIPAMYVAGTEEVEKISLFSDVNTDDRLTMEFVAPFEFFSSMSVISRIFLFVYPVDVLDRTGIEGSALTADLYYDMAEKTLDYKQDAFTAMKFLEKALELNPDHVKANYFKAQQMKKAGQMILAQKHFEKALRGGLSKEAKMEYLYFLMGQGATDKAEELLADIEPDDDSQYQLLYVEASINGIKGRHLEAADSYLKAVNYTDQERGKASTLLDAYNSLEKSGMAENALKTGIISRAIQLDPVNPQIAMEYAAILKDKGDFQQALQVLNRAGIANPDNVVIRFRILEIENILVNMNQQPAAGLR